MKLRSGKIIKQPLPEVLREKLESDLEDLKILLANNYETAQDLINIIATAPSSGAVRRKITDRIEEDFNNILMIDGKEDLYKTCGSLLSLITGDHLAYNNTPNYYHDTIQAIMLEAFDSDVEVMGAIDQGNIGI